MTAAPAAATSPKAAAATSIAAAASSTTTATKAGATASKTVGAKVRSIQRGHQQGATPNRMTAAPPVGHGMAIWAASW